MAAQTMIDAASQLVEDNLDDAETGTPRLARPLRVLHVIDVEASNYFLNNLLDDTAKEDVQFYFVTFGREVNLSPSCGAEERPLTP